MHLTYTHTLKHTYSHIHYTHTQAVHIHILKCTCIYSGLQKRLGTGARERGSHQDSRRRRCAQVSPHDSASDGTWDRDLSERSHDPSRERARSASKDAAPATWFRPGSEGEGRVEGGAHAHRAHPSLLLTPAELTCIFPFPSVGERPRFP